MAILIHDVVPDLVLRLPDESTDFLEKLRNLLGSVFDVYWKDVRVLISFTVSFY